LAKSTEKTKSYSNGWAYYKESLSWTWTSAQANWGVAPSLMFLQSCYKCYNGDWVFKHNCYYDA